jgi:hypothetical protein
VLRFCYTVYMFLFRCRSVSIPAVVVVCCVSALVGLCSPVFNRPAVPLYSLSPGSTPPSYVLSLALGAVRLGGRLMRWMANR